MWEVAGPPRSGTTGGTLAGVAEAGDLLKDATNGVLFVNEGTQASPYWTPVGYDQAPLWGAHTDFRDDGDGKALSDTGGQTILRSGVRVYGQGVAETDSGLVIPAAAEGGYEGRITTTNEVSHLIALGLAAGVMQPDQHSLLVIDVELSNVSAITARAMFTGFIGTAASALDPVVTGATTVATLVQDDLAGLWFDTGLTDGDQFYGVHNKSNAAATQDLTADGATGVNIAAAGTYQRFRVEITAAGGMTAFIDKAEEYTFATALDADEEVSPVVYLESQATAAISADIRRIAAYAYR